MKELLMNPSFLYKKLNADNFDLEQRLKSFYSGGMSDPCRLVPDNVLIFFVHNSGLTQNTPGKWHQRYQLKFNIGRESKLGIDDLVFNLKPDCGILIFPFQYHYCIVDRDSPEHRHLTISFDDIGNGRDSVNLLRNHVFKVDEKDYPLLAAVIGTFQRHEEKNYGEACSMLQMFLSRKLFQASEQPQENCTEIDPFRELLLNKIRENCDRSLTIKALAQMMQISESHMRRLAQKCFNGVSLGTFLRRIRFCHSYELLLHTNLPVGEIALKCGYADLYSFSRAFKLATGMSPTSFRKNPR